MSALSSGALAHRRRVIIGVVSLVIAAFAAADPDSAGAAGASAQPSNSVRAVQTRLAELKFLPRSAVDGKPGPRTTDAVTAFKQWTGLSADGVVGPRTLANLRVAAVPHPGTTGPSRRVEIYRKKGVTLLIDQGKVTRVMHSSAGKAGFETPTGTYRIQRKVLKDWSRLYRTWMPYASYFLGGYALHQGPVPAYPASHGCVRLSPSDAADAYRFATVGTAVIVY